MQEMKFKQHRPDNKVFRGWNWNMIACLNFIEIIQSLRVGKGILARFRHNVIASTKHPGQNGSEQ
jgi:hypothetical protein